MTPVSEYVPQELGEDVVISATFSGAPTGVSVVIVDPEGGLEVETTGIGIVGSTASFTIDASDFDIAGTWQYRFIGSVSGMQEVITGEVDAITPNEPELISLAELKNALGIGDNKTDRDEKLRQSIRFASAAIRNYTERDFSTYEVEETRTFMYYGSGGVVEIDDCRNGSITEVKINGATIGESNYYAEPVNGPVHTWLDLERGLLANPAMGFLRNEDVLADEGRLVAERQLVDVTATFGWPFVPGDVKQAAIWTAAAFSEKPEAFISEGIAGYTRTKANPARDPIPDRAKALLGYYQRIKI